MKVSKPRGHWYRKTDGLGATYESYAIDGSEAEKELLEAGFKRIRGEPVAWRREYM